MTKCPNCGKPINDNDKFCIHCGYRIKKQCLNCKRYNDLDAKFCIYCGSSFIQQTSQTDVIKTNNYDIDNQFSNTMNFTTSDSTNFLNSVFKSTSASVSNSVTNSKQVKSESLSKASKLEDHKMASNDNNDLKRKISTSISYIDKHLQYYKMQPVEWKYVGDNTALKVNSNRLKQAYATYYPHQDKMPKLYKIVNAYALSTWALQRRITLINKMLLMLHVSKSQLKIPKWSKPYSKMYHDYVQHVKGDEGEAWACHNLKKHGCINFDHNINIPFNYSKFYYKLCQYSYSKSQKLYRQNDYKQGNHYYYQYNCFKKDYIQKKNNQSYQNSNQIDLLYVNKYGIFIFEVKNYNHDKIWIDKHGRIAWANPQYATKPFGHQTGSLPIGRQIWLHKEAILSILWQHRGLFSKLDWEKIKHNIFGILVYVKSPKGSHGHIGVYKYDRSLKDHSDEYQITPVDQNHCYDAIENNSKQLTFTPEIVDELRNSIFAAFEKKFKLPVFYRNNIKSFNNVLRYKHELKYIYKLLRHQCYSKGILKRALKDDEAYDIFLTKRDKKRHALHELQWKANYWYFNKKRNKWCHAINKSDHRIQHYHHKYTKIYDDKKKQYDEFYK